MMSESDSLADRNVFACARHCLECRDPAAKCELSARTADALNRGALDFANTAEPESIGEPGRPEYPRLVAPRKLPHRRLGSPQGRVSLVHALAHIEFNAINLAWDAVYRFRGMPHAYYRDWARVAAEEAGHFQMLCTRLLALGAHYGSCDAHDGLWEMAVKTAHDPLVRMALVPRVLEARGLDVTPGIICKLEDAGDIETVEVLKIILRDEIGHVEVGTRWYRYLCAARGVDPDTSFTELVQEYMQGKVKPPFHYEARRQAGFNSREMAGLEELAARQK